MEIEQAKVDTLTPDPSNVRKHGQRNLRTIRASLERFGQQKPLVIDENGVVRAGNGTLAAAKQLGWESIAIVRTSLEGVEAEAFSIADNRSAELAAWTDELGDALKRLTKESDDILALGFDEDEIAKLHVDWGIPDPDPQERVDVPDVTVVITAKREAFDTIRETVEQWSERDDLEVSVA